MLATSDPATLSPWERGGEWQDEHKERPLNLLAGRLSLGSLAVVGLGQRKEQREACVGLLRPPRPGL